MKRSALLLLLACGLVAAQPPRVSRTVLEFIEQSLDNTIRRLDANDPYDLLGTTRGVYLAGYGAVFTCEVNLVITPVSPFHTPLAGAEIGKLYQKKLGRLALLKMTVRQALVTVAAALDTVPANEQIVIAVSLFYRSVEKRDGLPSQLLMQATRQALLDLKAGRVTPQALEAAIRTQEL